MTLSFKSPPVLFAIIFVFVLVLVGGFIFRAYQQHAGVARTDVSPAVANQYLPPALVLPDAASEVTVYVDFGAAESEFSISEDAFLAWCNTRGWSTKPISTPTTYFDPVRLPADTRLVNRGYTFAPPDGKGVFDSRRSRACFWTSSFP